MAKKDQHSVVRKLAQFFDWAPDEELTLTQIMDKYGCSYNTARYAVYELRERGLVESVHVVRARAKGVAREAVA